jgi:exodeoxyribonuclease-3
VCGDFNVAPEDRDVYNVALWQDKVMASAPEREGLRALLGLGLRDSFRIHHAEGGRYSWWDYRMLCFPRNLGLRIDHVLLSEELAARCRAADIDRDQRKGKQASDHAPVWAEFEI